ncbi:putative leucine-rich repeat-containing protein DDB_G0290503 isoform X5 [Octopus sinensis]|uniref:Leucine-rich repeat-containing protein DDB_G0290503 isoform X5 n=1 Tax=Octopus sinensis TaxID=2607531 RepID=A0A6P7S4Z8_9MOLL|nr:putative leucine-rich repeat-containing protein DDB_G0290503 isoform X5 [Octopus sinensis]
MASKCRKFVPNIFNKSKCQNCFAAKDSHSAQALENNKASRRASIWGYLFIAPDLDFANPLDKTKRWQRRFFVLYDDGELTYSVDENPDTVPQGEIDMNKCVDVYDAENHTGHQLSLAVVIPEKTYYIKGTLKEEISRWFEILVVYPRSIKTTKRRIVTPVFRNDREGPQSLSSEDSVNTHGSQTGRQSGYVGLIRNARSFDRFDIDKLKTPNTYRGVRSLKHKNDKHYTEGLRKSNSLHDLSSSTEITPSNLEASKFLSRSGDNLNFIPTENDDDYDDDDDNAFEIKNSRDGDRSEDVSKSETKIPPKISKSNITYRYSSGDKPNHRSQLNSFEEKQVSSVQPRGSLNRSSSLREKSPENKEFTCRLSLAKSGQEISIDGPDMPQTGDNELFYNSRNNETDELKMAKSSEMNSVSKQKDMKPERKIEDMMYMKQGWLIKQGSTEKDWKKHWFVLDANSLRYFKDAKAEEKGFVDGKIDLSTCYSVEEANAPRNYGFCIKNQNGEYVLTAMTSGLRKNWMQAIKKSMDMINKKEHSKPVRRHHSDVNPSNVGRAFIIRDMSTNSCSNYFSPIDSSNSKDHNVSPFLDSPEEQPTDPLTSGDGMLVDLLETEVQTLRRQLKEARDDIQQHKAEIESLKSKLDMSVSKLTGTEKALSEALKELKQEKEHCTKISSEWTKRMKNVEAQLRETSQKLEKGREALQVKEKECKRLETEVKLNMQKLRDSEREVIKLKAVENEYRQAKEKLDNSNRELECLRKTVKEKDLHCRKLEDHLKEMKHEYQQEKRDMREMSMSQSLSSDISAILTEKNDIINQLEEKLIESHNKIEELTDEMQNEITKGSALKPHLDTALKDNMYLKQQLQSIEKTLMDLQKKMDTDEKEKVVLKKQVDDQQREGKMLLVKLEKECSQKSQLHDRNQNLEGMMQHLNNQLQNHRMNVDKLVLEALKEKDSIYKQKLSEISTSLTSGQSLVSMVNSILQQIMDTQKKDYSHVLASAISSAAELESCLCTAQSVIEDLPPLTGSDASSSAAKDSCNIDDIKQQLNQAKQENKNLLKELDDAYSEFNLLKVEEQTLRERVKQLEDDYSLKLKILSGKIEDLTSKLGSTVKHMETDSHQVSESSKDIESKLEELEKRILFVGDMMKSQHLHSRVLSRQLLRSMNEFEESDSSEDSDQSESSQELSDSFNSDSEDYEFSDPNMSSIQDMNNHISSTNKLHSLPSKYDKNSPNWQPSKKGSLVQRLQLCEETTLHLSEQLTKDKQEIPELPEKRTLDEVKLAFHNCMSQVMKKLVDVNEEVRAIESAATKQQTNKLTPRIKDKLCYMIRYIQHVQNLTKEEWHILGSLYLKKVTIEKQLKEKWEAIEKNSEDTSQKIVIYAEKLALQIVVLGELSHLLQNNYLSNRCPDPLWKEINEVNQLFLQLKEKVIKDLDDCSLDNDAQVLCNYVEMLAQKIIVEGHLMSSMRSQGPVVEPAEKTKDLSEIPCLAIEAISRTLSCEYMEHQFQYLGDQLEKFSGHFTAQVLLQGEMTFALINLKDQITQEMSKKPFDFFVEESKSAFVKLKDEKKLCQDLVCKYKDKKLHQIQEILKQSSGQQNMILEVSQVHRLLQGHIKQYEEMLDLSLPTSRKCQIIHQSLLNEQESFMKTMQSLLQGNHQGDASDKDYVDNIKAHLVELADVLVLNATIRGQLTYISELYENKFGSSSESHEERSVELSISDDERRWETLMKKLGGVLKTNAKLKEQTLRELLNQSNTTGNEQKVQEIKKLLDYVSSTENYFPNCLTNFSQQVIRESVFQAQMCYLMEKLKLEYSEELSQMKLSSNMSSAKDLQLRDSKQPSVDVQGMLKGFEEIIEHYHRDEKNVISALKREIDSLKFETQGVQEGCNECDWARKQIENLEVVFVKECQSVNDMHKNHVDSIRKEITSTCNKMSKIIKEKDQDRDVLVSEYEDRIAHLQDELDCMVDEREAELEQVKMDITTAVGAIQASEHQTEAQLRDQVNQLSRNMAVQKNYFNALVDEVKSKISDSKLLQKIEQFQENLQSSSNTEVVIPEDKIDGVINEADVSFTILGNFEHANEDVTTPPATQVDQQVANPTEDEQQIREKEDKEIKAALESMRKAYDDDLDREKNQFREALKTMYTEDYVNEIRSRHEFEASRLQEELKTLNLHYVSKCEDYKMLDERLTKSKQDQYEQIEKILNDNKHLESLLGGEIAELKELMKKRSPKGLPAGSSSLEEDLYEAQIMIRMKDADLQKLKSQVTTGEVKLQRITEEHKQMISQYLTSKKLYNVVQDENICLKAKLEKAMEEAKPDQSSLQRRQQPVRRVPSFHHRARSPSPSHYTSQRKEEHISRDSHKGRRYQYKDIRRSKSSPSLPFVFGSKQLLGEKSLLSNKESFSSTVSSSRR